MLQTLEPNNENQETSETKYGKIESWFHAAHITRYNLKRKTS